MQVKEQGGQRMRLSEINWGADSAENDPHLLQYFYDSSAFRRISNRQKQLVIGRKGAGKSVVKYWWHVSYRDNPSVVWIDYRFERAVGGD
jgi:hypothetical protein